MADVSCSGAVLKRPHAPHDWEPQPGMKPVHCGGYDVRCSCGGQGITHFNAERHEPAPDDAHVRTVVEFFLQCQQPDGTWETSSIAMDQEWAEGRIAKRRVSMPEFEHRVVRRTTTTITSEMEPVEVRSNASYPREGQK